MFEITTDPNAWSGLITVLAICITAFVLVEKFDRTIDKRYKRKQSIHGVHNEKRS